MSRMTIKNMTRFKTDALIPQQSSILSYLYNVCRDGQVIQVNHLALPVDFMHHKIRVPTHTHTHTTREDPSSWTKVGQDVQ